MLFFKSKRLNSNHNVNITNQNKIQLEIVETKFRSQKVKFLITNEKHSKKR